MRGHIQQRGKNSWRISVYLGRDANGSKRYLRRTVQGTKREAEREVSRVVVEVDEGRHVATEALTVHQLLDRWLEVKALAVEQSTLASYEWIARTYVRPALGDRNVGSLRPIDLDLLYADLAARGLSNRTVRICHTVLRQSLEQARRWGFIARSTPAPRSRPRGRPSRGHPADTGRGPHAPRRRVRRGPGVRVLPLVARGNWVSPRRSVRLEMERPRS